MMLNSRFELSKIEKNTRVEREICLATLENREWKENLFLPLSKIESRKRIVSCHSRKSRVEREMGTIKFSRSREKFLFLLSIFLSRARLLSMPVFSLLHKTNTHPLCRWRDLQHIQRIEIFVENSFRNLRSFCSPASPDSRVKPLCQGPHYAPL